MTGLSGKTGLLDLFELFHDKLSGEVKDEILLRIKYVVRSAIRFKKKKGNFFLDNQIRKEAARDKISPEKTDTFLTIVSQAWVLVADKKFFNDFLTKYGKNNEEMEKKFFSKITIAYDNIENL